MNGPDTAPRIDRSKWPVPDAIKGASARDAFLWYVVQAWPLFFGGDEEMRSLIDHDHGFHVVRRGDWELRLLNRSEFPSEAFPDDDE